MEVQENGLLISDLGLSGELFSGHQRRAELEGEQVFARVTKRNIENILQRFKLRIRRKLQFDCIKADDM